MFVLILIRNNETDPISSKIIPVEYNDIKALKFGEIGCVNCNEFRIQCVFNTQQPPSLCVQPPKDAMQNNVPPQSILSISEGRSSTERSNAPQTIHSHGPSIQPGPIRWMVFVYERNWFPKVNEYHQPDTMAFAAALFRSCILFCRNYLLPPQSPWYGGLAVGVGLEDKCK